MNNITNTYLYWFKLVIRWHWTQSWSNFFSFNAPKFIRQLAVYQGCWNVDKIINLNILLRKAFKKYCFSCLTNVLLGERMRSDIGLCSLGQPLSQNHFQVFFWLQQEPKEGDVVPASVCPCVSVRLSLCASLSSNNELKQHSKESWGVQGWASKQKESK